MAATYTGQVLNGVIVLDEGTPLLPDGLKVQVEPVPLATAGKDLSQSQGEFAGIIPESSPDLDASGESTLTLAERLKPIIGATRGLPPDMAEQHDHYIHGTPRR